MKISFLSILLTILLVQTVRSVPFTVRIEDDEMFPFPSESPMITEEIPGSEEPSMSPDDYPITTEPMTTEPMTTEPMTVEPDETSISFTDEPLMEDFLEEMMPSVVRQVNTIVVSTPDGLENSVVTDGPTITPDGVELVPSPVPIPPIEPVSSETPEPSLVPTDDVIETIDPVTDTPDPGDTTDPGETIDGVNTFCEMAFDDCDYKFMGSMTLQEFPLTGSPDVAFTTSIMPKDGVVPMSVLSSDAVIPEFIGEDGSETPITLAGATPAFTPTHFKAFAIAGTSGTGIGHQTFDGDQESVAKGKCVRVSFSATSASECVVFKISA